jgi:hypothetical protein
VEEVEALDPDLAVAAHRQVKSLKYQWSCKICLRVTASIKRRWAPS